MTWFDSTEADGGHSAPISAETYMVVRVFQQHEFRETIERRLTLAEAQEHCSDPETCSSTATSEEARERTRQFGPWMDCFYLEQS